MTDPVRNDRLCRTAEQLRASIIRTPGWREKSSYVTVAAALRYFIEARAAEIKKGAVRQEPKR